MNRIYLDNNATTSVLPAVWEAMRPYLSDTYGNPASAHTVGRRARQALEDARERVAGLLGAFPDEVIFTSGGTEANNLALFGLAHLPYSQAKALMVGAFDKRYLTTALERCGYKVGAAARAAGMDRSNFRRLLKDNGIDVQALAAETGATVRSDE